MVFGVNHTSLEVLNNERFQILIPAFIFVIIFMVIGLLGNGMVLFIYGWRLKNSNIHVLLFLLACFDMVCCLIGLPLEIVDICLNFITPSRHLCKLKSFIIFYCCNASVLTLLAICVLRYYKVCLFNKPEMTVRQARLAAILITLVSLPIAIPSALFFDVKEMRLSPDLILRACLWRGSYDKLWIYFIVMLVCNLIILLAMFVLYGLIWVKAREHDRLRRITSDSTGKPRTKNRIFIGITALFAIGFLPGLILGVLFPVYEKIKLSNDVESFRNVVFRMWILNSTLNPVIYGFFGLRFRREVKNILNRSLSRTKSESTSEQAP